MTTFEKLLEPFGADEIEWRVQSSGRNDKGEWAKVLAYVTNRAIMDRLDKVCTPAGWQNMVPRSITGRSVSRAPVLIASSLVNPTQIVDNERDIPPCRRLSFESRPHRPLVVQSDSN